MSNLHIQIIGSGTVTVVEAPAINCPGVCVGPISIPPFPQPGYDGPYPVNATALAAPGYVFVGWTAAAGFSPTFIFNNYVCPSQYLCPRLSSNANESFLFDNSDVDYQLTAQFEPCPTLILTNNPLPCYTPGVSYEEQLIANGGTGPYTFTPMLGLCGPALSTIGLSMDANGLVEGTPVGSGTVEQNVRVTDANGCFLDFCVSIPECQSPCLPLTLVPPTFANGCLNEDYSETVTGSGGTPLYIYGVGGLPPGLSPDTLTTPGSLIISGTPSLVGVFNFLVIVTDANQCTTEVPMSITIAECIPIPTCYELVSCDESHPNILVNNGFGPFVGQFIQILGKCFEITIADACEGAITLLGLPDPLPLFVDCCTCNPPKFYTLTDCTLQTPQILTSTDLSQYAGQTIKVCDFTTSDLIQITAQGNFNCFFPYEQGYVTSITGPTSGFYYDIVADLIKPYTNPLLFPLVAGSGICANTSAPFDVANNSSPFVYTVQFFLGATPITNPIAINSNMSVAYCQYFIDQQIIVAGITITVTSFTAFGKLQVTVNTTNPVTDPLIIVLTPPVTVPPAFPPTTTTTSEFTGSCICYTVTEGTTCVSYIPFVGVISGVFPDCVCCLPEEPAPEPPPYVPTPPEIDKHTYRIPESQCDIDANTVFAAMTYDQYKQDQYGMESCCPFNINKIWIQKELSDLSKINC